MAELTSFADIKNSALNRANEAQDGTSDWDASAATAVTAAHRRLVALYPWICLEKYPPAAVLVPAMITDLTITTTAGLAAATWGGAAASYAASLKNYKIIPSNVDYVLRVLTHTAAVAALTVDAAPETLAAVACVVYLDEVDLPSDFNLFVNAAWTNGGVPIRIRSDESSRNDYPPSASPSWPPVEAVRVGPTKLRFSSVPDAKKRVEIPYTYDPGDPTGAAALAIDGPLRSLLVDLALPEVLRLKKAEAEARQIEVTTERLLARAVDREHQLRRSLFGQLSHEQPLVGLWS